MLIETFHTRLQQLQKHLSLTQSEFAEKTGISQSALCGYLSGKKSPTISVVEKITIVIGVNLNWLIHGDGPMFKEEFKENRLAIPIEDAPKEQFKQWLDEFWKNASPDERVWLKIELQKKFPDFVDWLKKQDRGTEDGYCMKKLA